MDPKLTPITAALTKKLYGHSGFAYVTNAGAYIDNVWLTYNKKPVRVVSLSEAHRLEDEDLNTIALLCSVAEEICKGVDVRLMYQRYEWIGQLVLRVSPAANLSYSVDAAITRQDIHVANHSIFSLLSPDSIRLAREHIKERLYA